jgi:hypothetical protein
MARRQSAGHAWEEPMMDTTTDAAETAREVRLRRAAQRQGLRLHKSRTRDPQAIGYGLFHISDLDNAAVAGTGCSGYSMSVDDVEVYLAGADDFAVFFDDPHGAYGDDDRRPFLEWRDSYQIGLANGAHHTWMARGWLLTERSDTPRARFPCWPRPALAQAARAARLTLAAWANDDREEAAE